MFQKCAANTKYFTGGGVRMREMFMGMGERHLNVFSANTTKADSQFGRA